MSASVQDQVAKLRHQRQPRGAQPRIVGHDEHVGEERSTAGRRPAISRERLPVVGARRGRLLDARTARVELREQRLFRRLGRARDAIERPHASSARARCS